MVDENFVKSKKILLVKPPIYEIIPKMQFYFGNIDVNRFFSYAMQPSALLRISTHLKSLGHEVFLIDCSAEIPKGEFNSVFNKTFVENRKCGNFENEKIKFPLYHCGMSFLDFEKEFKKYADVDEVWISCQMTYHWEAAHKIIEIIKKISKSVYVKLGGIYPTLCEEHARKSLADEVFVGEYLPANNLPVDLDILPYLPEYVILKSTRGCPNNCSYCAVHILEGRKMRFRSPRSIVEEMEECYNNYGIKRFIFWESNFLINLKNHFEKIYLN